MIHSPGRTTAELLSAFDSFAPTIAALWTGLRGEEERGPLRIGFTACAHGDGTTTVAASAAISLAMHGGREVVLVEASRSSRGLAELLEIDPAPGLEEVLRGSMPPDSALRSTDVPGLSILPIGGAFEAGSRALDGAFGFANPRAANLVALWERLSAGGRHVLVDGPPFTGHPDAIPILASLDCAAIVLNAQRTRKGQAWRTIAALEETGIRLCGTILNRCSLELPGWIGRRRT